MLHIIRVTHTDNAVPYTPMITSSGITYLCCHYCCCSLTRVIRYIFTHTHIATHTTHTHTHTHSHTHTLSRTHTLAHAHNAPCCVLPE